MPERLTTAFAQYLNEIKTAVTFWAIGASIGVGQHLVAKEDFSWRVVVGRALSTGGLSVVAGVALMPFPDIPPLAHIGIAAGIASLGTNSVELMFRRYLLGRSPG